MSGSSCDSISSIRSKPPEEKWLFSEDQLQSTPSRRDNVPPAKELNYRQQAANLIQDMGQRLSVSQLTINTAIVYMHRFYMFHSFQAFSRFLMGPTALFLAAKVEEQPRKLEHVIRECHSCLHPDKPHLDVHSDNYLKRAQQLVEYELLLLQTLGFDISIDHPHTHVVKCTQLVKASRELSQMAYFMATNSLHLTTFCLKYKPTVVSAMCIHLSCKWSNYEIPLSSEGKAYWTYMDPTITEALLENIINEFLKILNLCPTRLRKLRNYKPSSRDGSGGSTPQSKDVHQPKLSSNKSLPPGSQTVSSQATADTRRPGSNPNQSELQKKPSSLTIAEYKHKREKELKTKHTENATSADKEKLLPKHSSGSSQNAPPVRPGYSSAPKQPPHKPGNSDSRPPAAGSGSGVPNANVKTEQMRNLDKVHPKQIASHKRPDRSTQHGQKSQPGLPSGIPGLQKPKHPTHQGHGIVSQVKEHPKLQQQKQLHAPHNKPRETSPPKPREPQMSDTKITPGQHYMKSSTDPGENLLAGMEQKVMEQMKAEKARELMTKTTECPVPKPQVPHPPHNSSAKDHKSRHSMPDLPSRKETGGSHTQPPVVTKSSYKILHEQSKKNPEALRHQLKQKAATGPLTEEEKMIWHKLKKKEEDRQKRKRKHEKHKLNRSQPVESNSGNEAGNATPGSLTVRIKLPPSVRAEISKNQPSGSGTNIPLASSSGSGSEPAMSSPGSGNAKTGRKRTHAHDSGGLSEPISAKHSRKSESHHHQSSHHSSHDSSRHRHRHSRSGSHHHHQSKSHHTSHKIDEATFQQALSNAVSMVQSGQAVPSTSDSGKAIPTVTLKRTGVQNGSGEKYVAQSSKPDKQKASRRSKQLGFDPSAPVSAAPPEDLFDAGEGDQMKLENHEAVSENADVSSPETGEIIDDDERGSPLSTSRNRSGNQDQSYSQREHANNSNSAQERWGSSSGRAGYTNPPLLTHQNAKHEGRKSYDNRLPPLTIKPNRTDQR